MIGGAAAHAYFRGKTLPDAADTVSAVSGIRLPPECRFRWDCKRRKRFNAGVPGAVAPGKIILESPPSRWEGGWGGWGQKRKRRQCRQATKTASTPVWYRSGRSSRQPTGQAPRRGTCTAGTTSAARVQPRGCKGRSPLHKITLKSPPSRREGGRGDGGRKVNQRQGRQATTKARPPPGITAAGTASAARGQAPPPGTGTPPHPRPAKGKAPHQAPAWQVL